MKTYLLLLWCCTSVILFAQEEKYSSRSRIRVEQIAQEIIDKNVTLTFTDGKIIHGEPRSISLSQLKIEINGEIQEFPLLAIKTITVHAGVGEYLVVAIAGILTGGLGYGVSVLSFSSASTEVRTVIALLFGILGGWFSYNVIASDTVINMQ